MKTDHRSIKAFAAPWLALLAIAFTANQAAARQNQEPDGRDRTFYLYLENGTNDPVTFTVVPGDCYEGQPHQGDLGPVPPGGRARMWIARVQGHGCDGEQGYVGIRPSNRFGEVQWFGFSNSGTIGMSTPPNRFAGLLSARSTVAGADHGSYTWTMAEVEARLGPIDERLTMPRNPIARNFGVWDGGIEDRDNDEAQPGNVRTEMLQFRRNGFNGMTYSECATLPWFHAQHVVRLPNKKDAAGNDHAYFMVSNSNADVPDLPLLEAEPAGYLNLFRTDGVDPATNLVRNNSGSDGEIIWEHRLDQNSIIGEWNHPCKMEVIGGVLVVSMQDWDPSDDGVGGYLCREGFDNGSEQAIVFFDVRDPEHPKYWGMMTQAELGISGSYGDTKIENVNLFPVGSEWILSVNKKWWRTDHVSPNIEDWTPGGVSQLHKGQGQIFNSFELYNPVVDSAAPIGTASIGIERVMFGNGEGHDGDNRVHRRFPWSDPVFSWNYVSGEEYLSFAQVNFQPPDVNGDYYVAEINGIDLTDAAGLQLLRGSPMDSPTGAPTLLQLTIINGGPGVSTRTFQIVGTDALSAQVGELMVVHAQLVASNPTFYSHLQYKTLLLVRMLTDEEASITLNPNSGTLFSEELFRFGPAQVYDDYYVAGINGIDLTAAAGHELPLRNTSSPTGAPALLQLTINGDDAPDTLPHVITRTFQIVGTDALSAQVGELMVVDASGESNTFYSHIEYKTVLLVSMLTDEEASNTLHPNRGVLSPQDRFRFGSAQVAFSPTPTATIGALRNMTRLPGPNLWTLSVLSNFDGEHEKDYDACGVTVCNGMPVFYSPLIWYRDGDTIGDEIGDPNLDKIYQIWNPLNEPLQTPRPDQVVTSNGDNGPGTLRRAIAYGQNITFAPGMDGQTIRLTSGPLVVYLPQPLDTTDLDGDGITSERLPTHIDATGLPNGITLLNDDGLSPVFKMVSGNTLTTEGLESFVFATGDPGGWFKQEISDQSYALQSGDIGDGEGTYLETNVTVSQPETLVFRWKVSSESSFDFLRFHLDGAEVPGALGISGNVDWQVKIVSLPVGSHSLRWTYSKDVSLSLGSDAAWLADIRFSSTPLSPGQAISVAVSAAPDGSTVILRPGTYSEVGTIDFGGKAITLRSASGNPADTIIRGNGSSSVVRCISGEGPDTVLDGLTITGGNADYGGGMLNLGSSPTVTNCIFKDNSASNGGGMYNEGASPTVTNCIFDDNFAILNGGGMHNRDGANPPVTRCTFDANSAWSFGGGMYCEMDSSPPLTSCAFLRNFAGGWGGGLFQIPNSNSVVAGSMVANCVFSGNMAYLGAGMSIVNGSLINCTFSGNSSEFGFGGAIQSGGSPKVVNCVLWGNSPDEIYGAGAVVSFSTVEGGLPSGTTDGGGNISADPLFHSPQNLRLASGSPCSNTGDNDALFGDSADLDGDGSTSERLPMDLADEVRIRSCRVDMGAYESYSYAPYIAGCPLSPGDLIQNAVLAAPDGAELILNRGTYSEVGTIDFGGKAITLRSASGNPADTIIQGNGLSSVVRCISGEGPDTVLEGLTITNTNYGDATYNGGGMYNEGTSPTVTNCVFYFNVAVHGGGMYNDGASPTVTNCNFALNSARGSGGGMYNYNGASPTVTGCTFDINNAHSGAGMYCEFGSSPALTSCVFRSNDAYLWGGGLLQKNGCDSRVVNCVFSSNSANSGFDEGGGGGIWIEQDSSPTLINCTLNANWTTFNGMGGAIASTGADCFPTIINGVLWGNTPDEIYGTGAVVSFSTVKGGLPAGTTDGGGNISADPLFHSWHDLRLASGSPCLNAGQNDALPGDSADLDGDGNTGERLPMDLGGRARIRSCRVDMGAYEATAGSDCLSPGDSIQAAISAASYGGELVLGPGTHLVNETIDFRGKAITLRSASGDPADTILQGNGQSSVVWCVNGEGPNTVLEGLTITGGNADYGGGMYNLSSSPTVTNCIFTGNRAGYRGGGMFNSMGASPMVTRCRFVTNTAPYGAGMYCEQDSSPAVTNCAFLGNAASVRGGGLYQNLNSNSMVVNCVFSGNTAAVFDGAGMTIEQGSSPNLINCTFTDNRVTSGFGVGGAIAHNDDDSFPTLVNCVLWGNSPDEIGSRGASTAAVRFSTVQGGLPAGTTDGGGNISANPLFLDAGVDGYWASSVLAFSSQHSDQAWGAAQALGEPDTFSYGNLSTAWAPALRGGAKAFITLGFDPPISSSGVTIRETWGNGFVHQVDLLDTAGKLHKVWSGTDPSRPGSPVDFRITFPATAYRVAGVRVHVNTNHDPNAQEQIDAVRLHYALEHGDLRLAPGSPCTNAGHDEALPADAADLDGDLDTSERLTLDLDGLARIRSCRVDMGAYESKSNPDCNGNRIEDACEIAAEVAKQWADSVLDFSSQYGDASFGARQAVGEPDTFSYGDVSSAWAPSSPNGYPEFITLGFDPPAFAHGVTIRETWGNGFVYQVDLLDSAGVLHTVWSGTDPSRPGSPVDFKISFPPTAYLVAGVKVYVDTDHDPLAWEEVDAVRLHAVLFSDSDENGALDECETPYPTRRRRATSPR